MKAAVIWDWNHNHIIARQEYEHWQVLSDQFKLKGIGKDPGSWPANDIPTIPDWNTYRQNGLPVKFMLSVVEQVLLDAEGDGTTENPGLFPTMVQNAFADRSKLIKDRLSKLSIQTDGTWYWYLDTDPTKGGTSPKVAARELAELHMKAKSGALIAFWWDYYTQSYGLAGLDLLCLTAFSQAIKLWNAARASVSFWAYTVQKGDTLDSILANFTTDPLAANPVMLYDSPLYDKAIFDTNTAVLTPGPRSYAPWQDVALTPGQVLMLPDKEVVDFTIYTITAADRYPYTICEKFFGDRLLRDPLDAADAGMHYPMNEFTFGAGTVIRVPKLYWAYPAPDYAPTSKLWATNQVDPVTKVPYYPIQLPNGQVIDSLNWVPGFRVRYSVSFFIKASDTMIDAMETHRGPWTDWLHSDGYFHPILENIPADLTKQATSRRIYRQFHDEDARVELVGEIAGNDPATPASWPDMAP